ncbi:MAG TPA: DUF4231 domain-containing protein [Candidatus Krumholzibacteria bacterium]|nr:DUF4231 domain-containing protein [Candidatus Krumholzibacteria bacterium]HPD70380.1 DUF4231 domain-containing protein [Candidatus Krumholzibacteria bacterium]HRY39920.1 DUF4231 domain-containing protein [Candidatus Krumholzibacteria bacterium]
MPSQDVLDASDPGAKRAYLLERYGDKIRYYWAASRSNKNYYKRSRFLAIVFGALVTFTAALASADFVANSPGLDVAFRIATPVLALLLTIITGFSQTFHWGATWRDMVINAEYLEKDKDRIALTTPAELDFPAESDHLNDLVIAESRGFFERILGGGKPPQTGTAAGADDS